MRPAPRASRISFPLLEGFHRNDRVITPSGEIARVVGTERTDGRLELEYVGALRAEHGQVVLPAKLVRKCDGLRLPAPVRVR